MQPEKVVFDTCGPIAREYPLDPDAGSPAKIIGGATGERLAEPADRKVIIVLADPSATGLTVEQLAEAVVQIFLLHDLETQAAD